MSSFPGWAFRYGFMVPSCPLCLEMNLPPFFCPFFFLSHLSTGLAVFSKSLLPMSPCTPFLLTLPTSMTLSVIEYRWAFSCVQTLHSSIAFLSHTLDFLLFITTDIFFVLSETNKPWYYNHHGLVPPLTPINTKLQTKCTCCHHLLWCFYHQQRSKPDAQTVTNPTVLSCLFICNNLEGFQVWFLVAFT